MVRFNSRANPTPSRTTHNTLLEVIWTVVPVHHPGGDRGSVVQAAVPANSTIPPADVTVKATGKQWYWSYSYPGTASSSSTR